MHRIFSDELLHCRRKPVQVDILFLDFPVDSRSIRKHFHDLSAGSYEVLLISGDPVAHLNKPLFDLVFIQMRHFALLTILKLVVTLPDHTTVFGSRMPNFRAEETATAGAYQFC